MTVMMIALAGPASGTRPRSSRSVMCVLKPRSSIFLEMPYFWRIEVVEAEEKTQQGFARFGSHSSVSYIVALYLLIYSICYSKNPKLPYPSAIGGI